MMTKRLALLASFLLAAGVAVAGDETTKDKGKSKEVSAEVVSVDAIAKTITIKDAAGNKTVPVNPKALTAVKDLKSGQKVTLLCKANERGEPLEVTGVKSDTTKPPQGN